MDQRKYDPISHVAASHFNAEQRTRLEAFTAARQLKPGENTYEQLDIAAYIVTGEPLTYAVVDD